MLYYVMLCNVIYVMYIYVYVSVYVSVYVCMHICMYVRGARCNSVVRAFAHGSDSSVVK